MTGIHSLPMKRGGAGQLTAAIALLTLVACSSSTPRKTIVAPIVTNSKSVDTARARTIVLTKADFPAGSGWLGTPHSEDASDKAFERRFAACSGITDTKGQTADEFSQDFNLDPASVGSEASFYKTSALAKQDMGTVNNPRALPCARSALIDLLRATIAKQLKGARLGSVTLVRTRGARYGY